MDQELNVNLVKNQSTCMIIRNATNFETAFLLSGLCFPRLSKLLDFLIKNIRKWKIKLSSVIVTRTSCDN